MRELTGKVKASNASRPPAVKARLEVAGLTSKVCNDDMQSGCVV